YSSSREGADRAVEQIKAEGGKAVAVQGDVSKATDVRNLFAQTKKTFGRLDVLVNNAGVYQFGPIESFPEEEFHREFNTNVLGPIPATKEALNLFGPEGGSVINISSVVSSNALPGAAVYSATKSALDSLTRTLAAELGPRKVRVNAINPGVTETEGAQALPGFLNGPLVKDIVTRTPLGRTGQPEDIASAVVFLASDDSRWVTGEA